MDTIIYDWRLTGSHPLHVQYSEHRPGRVSPAADMHSSVHVGILIEGDTTGLRNGEKLTVRAGELYLTAPWEPHRTLGSEQGNKLLLLTADPDAVDRQRRFKWRDGEVVVNFGKNSGRTLRDIAEHDPGFLRWIVRSDFPEDVKTIARDALIGNFPTR